MGPVGQISQPASSMNCRLRVTKRTLSAIGCLVLLLTPLVYSSYHVYSGYDEWSRTAASSIMAMEWEGFGPEQGLYNFTVVTAMLDIGRGSWTTQNRSYNTYLLYMQHVLRLDVNFVVFVDNKGKPFVEWMRRGRENHTHIIVTDQTELPYYKLRNRIAEIMESEKYRHDNELVKNQLAESRIPEYDILQLSKLYFIHRAITDNPFKSTYFFWMDGGYGKGQNVHPADGIWIPRGLFEHPDKITLIDRYPGVESLVDKKDQLHKMSVNVLVGGFFGGGIEAFQKFYQLQQKQMDEWMREGIIDDDQTMNMHLYFQNPSLFRLVRGNWYDAFTTFNARYST